MPTSNGALPAFLCLCLFLLLVLLADCRDRFMAAGTPLPLPFASGAAFGAGVYRVLRLPM